VPIGLVGYAISGDYPAAERRVIRQFREVAEGPLFLDRDDGWSSESRSNRINFETALACTMLAREKIKTDNDSAQTIRDGGDVRSPRTFPSRFWHGGQSAAQLKMGGSAIGWYDEPAQNVFRPTDLPWLRCSYRNRFAHPAIGQREQKALKFVFAPGADKLSKTKLALGPRFMIGRKSTLQ